MEKLPFAITLAVGSSLANKTGAWRTERPVYVDLLPPCNDACPAGENIQRWLFHAEEKNYEAAWRQIMMDNPLPAIMGRVCYHSCQTACNRCHVDEAVGINSVERFLGDEALRQGWTVPVTAPRSGKKVLVVGAGPAGLAAAYHLNLLGHDVTIRDAGAEAGGMMRYGIPKYRLPREILDAEINRIINMGITLELNTRVDDVAATMEREGFAAAFLAIGAQLSKNAYLPAGDSAKVVDALSVLRDVAEGEPVQLGRRVIVYGGGNTAMDAARTARRLGATETLVVYRRTRERMPAQAEEVEEAIEEGVKLRWLSTISYADGGTVTVEKMALDESGFPQPTGEFEELVADSVVLAIGQEVDRSILDTLTDITVNKGVLEVGPGMATGHAGVFAGGDLIGGEQTVTAGIGHGKRASRRIDAFLRGEEYKAPTRPEIAGPERLHSWYYSDAPATVRPHLAAARRIDTFDEVVGGLDESNALFEARRCMSCGNCFECDNCFGMCPDNAIIKLGPGNRFRIDLDYCKGCGICAAECPCGAINMVPENG
jgi:NADPH-dependent glutamate synthase beta subunit-like oxidoreductase